MDLFSLFRSGAWKKESELPRTSLATTETRSHEAAVNPPPRVLPESLQSSLLLEALNPPLSFDLESSSEAEQVTNQHQGGLSHSSEVDPTRDSPPPLGLGNYYFGKSGARLLTEDEQKQRVFEFKRCRKMIAESFAEAPLVTYMNRALAHTGCPIGPEFVECARCDKTMSATIYLNPQTDSSGIMVCENNIRGQHLLNDSLTHEMIHMYDHCRSKADLQNNCAHVACTEIRAANLSGNCLQHHEVARGYIWRFGGGHGLCVRRRAIQSLQGHPKCARKADEWVDSVMDRCMKDQTPFQVQPWYTLLGP